MGENKTVFDILELDGETLTIDQLMAVTETTHVQLTEDAWRRVRESRDVVEEKIALNDVVYGINTGVGSFSKIKIDLEKLKQHQYNIVVSHAAGLGNSLSPERVKRMLILRLNVLAKGFSGVSAETLERMLEFCNKNCLSKVPEQGTVGASGDLCPLSHLALGMLGEGEMWDIETKTWNDAQYILTKNNLKPLDLKPKEGVTLINGSQFITSLGVEAIARAENLAVCADILTSMTLEALHGTEAPFVEEIHRARPHPGQIISAKNIRSLLQRPTKINNSIIPFNNSSDVQDAYCLRCAPQVHGIVYDTIKFAKNIIETEMNSATDNPLVFSDSKSIISGGNFHAEYCGKALDFLAIAVQELGSISERRIERLLNGNLSGLPHFLINDGGINSGFMMLQITAAALASENKSLSHPATADSIPTNAAKEDHVSMAGWAARKVIQVVENVEAILGLELLASSQGLEIGGSLKSTKPIEEIVKLIRKSGIKVLDKDRYLSPDIEKAKELISKKYIFNLVKPFLTDC